MRAGRGPASGAGSALLLCLLVLGAGGARLGLRGAPQEALQARIRARLDALPARTALYAKHLPSGREIAIRADEPVNTLSVIKVAVMLRAYRDAEAGAFDLDEGHTVTSDELRRGSGLLQTFQPGLRVTHRDLVTQMIVTSDNTATDILIRKLGIRRIDLMLEELGYRETRLRTTTGQLFRALWEAVDPGLASLSDREVFERGFPSDSAAPGLFFAFEGDSTRWLGRTTAREMGRLLEQLYRGELASPEHTREMLRILEGQFYASLLPRRIQYRVRVAHKTGGWGPVAANDAGILLYEGGPTVVCLFAGQHRGDLYELEETFGRIAEEIVDSWR